MLLDCVATVPLLAITMFATLRVNWWDEAAQD